MIGIGHYIALMFAILFKYSKKGLHQPPRNPKIESYFTTFSLDCFIRCMIQVLLFHIDLTLMVAIVTENGHQNKAKIDPLSSWTKIWRFKIYF